MNIKAKQRKPPRKLKARRVPRAPDMTAEQRAVRVRRGFYTGRM